MTETTTNTMTSSMAEMAANEYHNEYSTTIIMKPPFTTANTITIASNSSNNSTTFLKGVLENRFTENITTTTILSTTSLWHNGTFDTSDNDDDYDADSEVLRTIEYIGTVLSFYYVPIIVGTGSIGNILSVFVFFKTKLSKLSSSFYLAALAVSDTCFLLGLFAQWLNFVDIHIYNREYFCQFFTFFSNLACFCSVWFVVAFTVERFIAVMYPLRRQTMCTVRRAKMVLVGLTILGCLHCAPFWISSTPVYSPKLETTICDIKSEYKDYITILNYWDTIVVFAVPFTTIAVLNTFTGCTVWKFATVRRTLTMQKMKTQHLPLHGTMSSPTSSCSARETAPVTMSMATTSSAASSTTTTTTTATMTQQGISTYRITTSSSLKRQKSISSTMQLNGQHHHRNHHHIAGHHPNQHLHHMNQQDVEHHLHNHHHLHSHPNRATMIKHATSGNSDYGEIFSRKSRRKKVTNSSQLKVTKMLLIVSTVFVCLNLPSFIMRMITYLEKRCRCTLVFLIKVQWHIATRLQRKKVGGLWRQQQTRVTQSSTNEKTTVVLQYIFQLLFITNFGINFVLYCVSGQNFRKAVLSMFRKVSTTQRDGTTQITVSEYYRNSGGLGGAFSTNTSSTRKRIMNQNSWNEIHELQRIK